MRRRLVSIAALTLAAALVPVTGLFYLVLSRTLEGDAHRLLQARAAAVGATIDLSAGRVLPRETTDDAALDTSTWVFDPAGRLVEHPLQRSNADQVAQALAHVRRPVRQDVGDLALLAVPLPGQQSGRGGGRPGHVGTVVASLSRIPYKHAEHTALAAAISLDLVVLLAVGVLTWHTVSAALAPVARMTTSAADWGAHDAHQRFNLGPATDELTGLAATLDGLLARLSASLGHERRLTAEIAHELRTPITRIRAEAEVALLNKRSVSVLRQVLTDVVADAAQVASTIDALLATAAAHTAERGGTSSITAVVEEAIRQVGFHADQVDVDQVPPAMPDLAVEEQLAVRTLVPVLENASKYGTARTRVGVRREADRAVVEVGDDGPGFTPAEAQSAFQPGVRGAASAGTVGAGLGLALARRLARAAGGDVIVDQQVVTGGRVLVAFPLTTLEPAPEHRRGRALTSWLRPSLWRSLP
jgi:two-component system, OmpR family, sensor kinase